MAGTPPVLEEDAEAAWELLVFGVEEPPPPAHGDAESAAWFRTQLQELGFTQGSFARWMRRRGDDRSERGTRSHIQRMCAGKARISAEMRVLLGLMLRSKQRRMARAARERDERDAPWNDPPETRGARAEAEAPDAPRANSSETRGGRERRDERAPPPDDAPEERRERRGPEADEAPGNDPTEPRSARRGRDRRDAPPEGLSETHGGQRHRDERAPPPGDSSETRGGREERDAGGASGGISSETHRGRQERPDGCDTPPRHSSETRAEQAPGGKW